MSKTNGALTKQMITDTILSRLSAISGKDAAAITEAILDAMKDELVKGNEIKISGFGKFQVREKKARIGRNPRTGEQITIEARRVLRFYPSDSLRDTMNEPAVLEKAALPAVAK